MQRVHRDEQDEGGNEQKDANEYSEMLGYLTEKAVSVGESRPRAWGGSNAGSDSENVSDQRRALMLPQEMKELGQEREIIIAENTKPILCDKARYYADDAFLDRLKSVSPTLKALEKKRPTQAQLEDVAFMLGELSVRIPIVDFDLHKARVESRTRPLRGDEAIDVSRLSLPLERIPRFVDPERPTELEAEVIVDRLFGAIEWSDGREVDATPVGRPLNDAAQTQAVPANEADRGGVVLPMRAQPRPARTRAVDLSMVDR